MNKMLAFSSRNTKEILRDRITLFFGLGFPLVLLVLLTVIQSNVPVDIFSLTRLTPGIANFGFSFIALFSGTLISKDRSSSLILRLFTSPLTAKDFIFGYTLPLFPMAAVQCIICYVAAIILGLEVSGKILLSIVVLMPSALLYIAIGLLCGSVLNDKQVGAICGTLVTNLTAWLSGTWFSLDLVGGVFKKIAELLPFVHAVNAGEAALTGAYGSIMPELLWVFSWAAATFIAAVVVFRRKMRTF